MIRAYYAVLGAIFFGQAAAFLGPASSFITGSMSAGLMKPGATACVDRKARTCRRAQSGAASTKMMPIGVPKVTPQTWPITAAAVYPIIHSRPSLPNNIHYCYDAVRKVLLM